MIKVLIADDQELIRHSLQIVLSSKQNIEVTDAVADGLEVIRSVRKNKPDVILMDIRMPKMDGVQCTKIIKENYPEIKIIILTTFDDDEYIYDALKLTGWHPWGRLTGSEEAAIILQEYMEESEKVIDNNLLSEVLEQGMVAPQFLKYKEAVSLATSEIRLIIENDKNIDSSLKILQNKINQYLKQ